jgi:hypothetical protein
MSHYNFRFKIVSIAHLVELQDSVGKLIRHGLVSKQLYKNWHFYLSSNKNLPIREGQLLLFEAALKQRKYL